MSNNEIPEEKPREMTTLRCGCEVEADNKENCLVVGLLIPGNPQVQITIMQCQRCKSLVGGASPQFQPFPEG